MFAEVERDFGGLDVLVNNAGIGEVDAERPRGVPRQGRDADRRDDGGKVETHWDVTQSLSDETWARMLAVHLNGTFYCTREALKLMSRVNRGAIVNISSVAGLMGIEVAPHYGAAKAGILGFTRSVAREVATRGIRVNAICPGWIDTPMPRPDAADGAHAGRAPDADGPPRRSQEIAAVALFLASDEASFVTGQWLSPNGGLLTI